MSRKQYRSRFEKRKQNRTLNIAIGVVILLIIIVGANIFMNGGSSPTSSSPAHGNQDKKNHSSSSKTDTKKKDDSIVVDEDKNKDSSGTDQNSSSQKDDSEDKNKDDAAKKETDKPEGGGPDGPWDPVGTSQSGTHTKSYDKGTPDWNEQTKALSYATGIPEDQMTLLWLGNGGAPDKSVGRVLSKEDGSRYEVQLQWEDGKGWKPTSVTKN